MDTDEKLFKEIFYQLYQPLCNYAYKYLQDRAQSEDVVQDLYTKIWDSRRDLLSSKGIKYYLYVSVRNSCVSLLRKRILLRDFDDVLIDIVDEVPEQPVQEDPYQLINRAFDGIPPKCLAVFKLSRIERLSYKEIAQNLGISVKTVENQLGKAMRHVRKFISEHPHFIFLLVFSYYFGLHKIGFSREYMFYLKEI